MILAISMGNTNTVTGGMDEIETYSVERVTTDQEHMDIEYAVSLKNILGMHRVDIVSIEGATLSPVALPVNSIIPNAVGKMTGIRPLLVGSGMRTGMNIIMDNPRTVGSDQTMDAVVASHEHSLSPMVIDMGTATTLCIVDKKGNYIDGVILSDLRASLNSPSSKTAQLPYISLEVPSHVIGKNTTDCVRSGITYDNVGMIDGILDHMEKELGELPIIIATGGLVKFTTPLCHHKTVANDVLFLKELLILYRKNTEVH